MFVYEYAFLFRMKERERDENVTDGKVGNRSDPSDDNSQ